MIVINLKNYKVGAQVSELVRTIELYYSKAIVAVPITELKDISKNNNNSNLHIYAQHVDYQEPGRGTGFLIPESLINAGVSGSLLNHSEHRLKMSDIRKTIKRCNEVGLKLIICTSSLNETRQLVKLKPHAIAFEDNKLIATGKSITEYSEHALKKFVQILEGKDIIPLCGAGITSGEDVAAALILGCKGVLVSSIVANNQNPEKFLKEIGSLF